MHESGMSMTKPYLLVIYGKDGCVKCARLKKEISALLAENEASQDFGLDYQNLSTVDGMIAYAASETVNGQRIPALQVFKYDTIKESYIKMPDMRSEAFNAQTQSLFVPVYLQLETDYQSENPDITREKVMDLMDLARQGV